MPLAFTYETEITPSLETIHLTVYNKIIFLRRLHLRRQDQPQLLLLGLGLGEQHQQQPRPQHLGRLRHQAARPAPSPSPRTPSCRTKSAASEDPRPGAQPPGGPAPGSGRANAAARTRMLGCLLSHFSGPDQLLPSESESDRSEDDAGVTDNVRRGRTLLEE